MEGDSFGALLPEMRLDFWDSLWHGQIATVSALKRRLSVLKLPLSANAPCRKCVLRLKHGDAYLDHIWRYGRDRLRVAIGNLLPDACSGIVYGVCRLTPRHVYILACAADGMHPDTLAERAGQDIGGLIEALEQYLDLESELKEIGPAEPLSGLTGGK